MSFLPGLIRTSSKITFQSLLRIGVLKSGPAMLLKRQPLASQLVLCQGYAKPAKGGSGGSKKKNPNKKGIADLIDELDSDDEDDDDVKEVARTEIEQSIGDTPAAHFINKLGHHNPKALKKDNKKGHRAHVSYQEAKVLINIDLFWKELEAVCQEQQEFFKNHITLRTTSALDDLQIELEGDTYPLREIADISKKDPKRLIIDTSAFPQATITIMNVLRGNKGLNLNPQQEGTRIYVPIPKVTREHREKLAKSARQKCNDTKDHLKKVQSKKLKELGDLELSGRSHAPKDHFSAIHDVLMSITEHFAAEAETMMLKKQKDLMDT